MKLDKGRYKVSAFLQSCLFQEIIFIDRRIQQAVIAGKNVMGKFFFEKAVISLRKIGLKVMGAFVYGDHIRVIAIVKRN